VIHQQNPLASRSRRHLGRNGRPILRLCRHQMRQERDGMRGNTCQFHSRG
jgi:hypothetical protein